MDTSMDDLFADMDRSNQAAVEIDHPVKETNSENSFFHRFRAFDEEIGIKIWRHEDLSNALVYEISMNYHDATVGQPVQFVSPWCPLFSGFATKLYPSLPPVQPCALICKANFRVDQNKVSLPVFALSNRWQNFFKLHLQAGSDSIPLVWLISFSNGAVYYFVRDAEIRYALLFSLPCCEPISLWSVIESPIMTKPSSTLPSPVPNDLVVALSGSGSGAAIWLCSEDKRIKQVSSELRVNDFRTPVAPSPVCDIQTHGSWLHLVTTSGHVLSLHISYGRRGASQTGDEWQLICQPGNFPRVPTHMIPAINATDQLQLVPKWRYFDLRGFVRMSDGHLGGKLSTGEKIRLVDLLCGYETVKPQGNECLGSLNSTVNTLINTHCRLRAYRALLQLLGFLDVDGSSPKLPTGPETPLRRLVSVKMQTSLVTNDPVSSIEDSPFELSVIVSLEAPPPAQMNNSLAPTTPLQSFSAEELTSLLLHPESRTSSFERELFLVMRLTPLTFSATENHLKQDSTGLPIFTYSEPWFSSCHQWTRVDLTDKEVESALQLNEQLISYFVPTGQYVVFSWKYASSHQPDRPTELSIELSVSAKCSNTLWLVHESLQRRLQLSVIKVPEPPLPSVEVLRQEYSILKSMEDSLKQRCYSSNDVDNLREFGTLLQVFSTVRNTAAVRSMMSRTPDYLAMTAHP
ncbi:hypothetical protein CLF_103757 [Clonorchis sinensis]|uniref:Uncharacterized protein n=1 Tax=Clonorchis sinensis TaxID=79923 RepID=G7YAB5_CLOSI|nr:hypothetical protein CLF_103757 [Clonorchis sinensis]